MQIVAEIKKASPSRGVLAETLDPEAIAEAYTRGGAAGDLGRDGAQPLPRRSGVAAARSKCVSSRSPPGDTALAAAQRLSRRPLRARWRRKAYGADNVLLIVAILDDALLGDLLARARELELDALVEVHNEAEAERAVKAGATLFGINNRDLHTFNVDLGTTEHVRPLLPAEAIVIGESGVHTKADVERLHRAGVRAILVGEAFMTAPDVAAKMSELRL